MGGFKVFLPFPQRPITMNQKRRGIPRLGPKGMNTSLSKWYDIRRSKWVKIGGAKVRGSFKDQR